MLFRKRHKPSGGRLNAGGPPRKNGPAVSLPREITFDMMRKGATVRRGTKMVRQFAVMVGSHMHLVTSGDEVDGAVYDALVAAEAVEEEDDAAVTDGD